MLSSIFILDAANLEAGPVAIIELPFRLRAGIHGSWVAGNELPKDEELCDMTGVTDAIRNEFSSTVVSTPFPSNAPLVSATINGTK